MLRVLIIVWVLTALPITALADRGALSLELGPTLSIIDASPSQGAGSGTIGTAAGAALGVRYGVTNSLELAATGVWESAADYFHSGVEFGNGAGIVRGTLAERVQRYGAMAGARLVWGLVWRFHLGLEVGWNRTTTTRRDLIDVSVPGNEHSFGLALRDRVSLAVLVAPIAGLEWQFGDHWAATVMPRLELALGTNGSIGVVVPVCVAYSWFVF